MTRGLGFLVLGIAAAVAACTTDTSQEPELSEASELETRPELAQINDVSILFPLAKSKPAFEAVLSPASAGRGGSLLPATTYERAFGPPGTLQIGGTPPAPALAGLRLVAMRFDPCFAALGPLEELDEATCKNQLRLIFQSVTLQNGKAVAGDDAVHAFYSISRDELRSGIQSMIDLRRRHVGDRRLGSLGPHPLLLQSNGDVDLEVLRELNALIVSLAGAENLVEFTQFAPSGRNTTWNFSGFDVETDSAVVIPTLPADDNTHVAFFAGFTPSQLEGDPAFVPASNAAPADNMQLLGNRMTAAAASVDQRRTAFAALLRIEHPEHHSPDTTDCASCHAVEPARQLVGKKFFASEMSGAGAFEADERWVPQADLKQFDSSGSGINVHMFSYKGTIASVHQRVINESAAVVAHVNSRILGQ